MKTSLFYKIVSFIFVVILSSFSFACNETPPPSNNDNEKIVVNGVEINDSFVKLNISDLQIDEIDVSSLTVESILVNSIEVTEIEIKELEVVTINDEFIYIAYQNFVEYYGEDFDLKQFLLNVGIGATVIIVCVTLSTVGGPVGTFFGGVICSEFSAGAICVGAAIDAAITGYQAYQEGGDMSYILGHMLNGVAEGFMWGAILAPITGLASGIKAVKAVKKLSKMPGFENYTQKQLNQLIKSMPDIIKSTAKCAADTSDDVLKQIYKQSKSNLAKEITEEIFVRTFKNKDLLIDIIKKYNPFDICGPVIKELKQAFFEKANISKELAQELIKKISKNELKNIDDLAEYGLKDFVNNNLKEFLELFGKSISKDFLETTLKKNISENAYNAFKNVIGKNKNTYCALIDTLGKNQIDNILKDYNSLLLLQLKFGTQNINDLIQLKKLYSAMQQNNSIAHSTIKSVIDGIYNNTIKSLDNISIINTQLAKNMQSARDVVAESLKQLGLGAKTANLLNDIAVQKIKMHLKNTVSIDTIKDIVCKNLTKNAILTKYGQELYNELVEKSKYLLGAFNVQNATNTSLIKSIITDSLLQKQLSQNTIDQLLKGTALKTLELSTETINEIGNIIAEYYRITNFETYLNFIDEFAEIRCSTAKAFNESINYTPLNGEYASKIKPSTNPYIQEKYGDIYYNSAGYPIFDQHAVARIELPDLNGLDGGSFDIKRANQIHHGTQENVPGYTWHHLEDGKTLILIPTELHDAKVSGYGHSGGAKLLRDGAFGVRS